MILTYLILILVPHFLRKFLSQCRTCISWSYMSSLFQNSNKNYLKIFFIFKNYFDPVFGLDRSIGPSTVPLQARTVGRTVDRTSGNWGVDVMHIPGRLTGWPVPYCGRPTDRPVPYCGWSGGRLTVTSLVLVKHGRSTGRPRDNGQILLNGRSTSRSTDILSDWQ